MMLLVRRRAVILHASGDARQQWAVVERTKNEERGTKNEQQETTLLFIDSPG